MGPERWLVNFVSLAVTVAWLAALAASVISGDYTALEVVTPVMLTLAGFTFGIKITRGGGKE